MPAVVVTPIDLAPPPILPSTPIQSVDPTGPVKAPTPAPTVNPTDPVNTPLPGDPNPIIIQPVTISPTLFC
jgi:hypothetical protein